MLVRSLGAVALTGFSVGARFSGRTSSLRAGLLGILRAVSRCVICLVPWPCFLPATQPAALVCCHVGVTWVAACRQRLKCF